MGNLIKSYLKYRGLKVLSIQRRTLDSSDDLEWITVKGNHIPIKEGQSTREALSEFYEKVGGKKQKEKTDFTKLKSTPLNDLIKNNIKNRSYGAFFRDGIKKIYGLEWGDVHKLISKNDDDRTFSLKDEARLDALLNDAEKKEKLTSYINNVFEYSEKMAKREEAFVNDKESIKAFENRGKEVLNSVYSRLGDGYFKYDENRQSNFILEELFTNPNQDVMEFIENRDEMRNPVDFLNQIKEKYFQGAVGKKLGAYITYYENRDNLVDLIKDGVMGMEPLDKPLSRAEFLNYKNEYQKGYKKHNKWVDKVWNLKEGKTIDFNCRSFSNSEDCMLCSQAFAEYQDEEEYMKEPEKPKPIIWEIVGKSKSMDIKGFSWFEEQKEALVSGTYKLVKKIPPKNGMPYIYQIELAEDKNGK